MKTFKVTFVDEIVAESEDAAYKILVEYLKDCGKFEDVSAFEFKEIKKKVKAT